MRIKYFILFGLAFLFAGCPFGGGGGAPVSMEINLFSGVPMVAKLGDSEKIFLDKAQKYGAEKFQIDRSVSSEGVKFNTAYSLKDYGMTIFFRTGRVALIELQDPFRGNIMGKKLKVFNLVAVDKQSWDQKIIREFGIPSVRAAGGRLSSEGFFYSWGDISFNKMGPNEIALYRDWDIANFRQKNFGRNVKLFKDN